MHVGFYGSSPVTYARTPILAGDYLTFCLEGVSTSGVNIEILYDPTYETMFSQTFSQIGPCA